MRAEGVEADGRLAARRQQVARREERRPLARVVEDRPLEEVAQVAAAYPAIVTEVLSTLKGLTGVDIKNLLSPVEGGSR